ncbi:Zinc finger and BTB domain containing protein 22 [Dissostichus eleginoides]|uniref:Zinc finger and BTB domain containing protein 22 n=1 Tax=Dissostichus eleginoides TaxID=100907 RepID=A0AAD9BCJ2_DISEL|nr:Zinc finger and BTB domain containing protein 22 [Dissostichus eleginoides]
MQSLPVEVGSSSSSAPRDTSGPVVQVCFPSAQGSVLGSLNQQREDGQLCDLSIHVQGHVFKAHRCVLAASSPYFHDQVLLKNMSTVSIPAVMDPLAFESVLSCAYTGELRMLRDDIVNYLTVGSVLQISSNGEGMAGGGNRAVSDGGVGDGVPQVVGSNEPQRASLPPSRPSVSESQSPSSTNYFSPRDGGGAAAAGASADRGGASNTPSYLSEQEVGVSDSFGVSSYQDGDHLLRRPAYSQPSIMPRKQWVVVKTERMEDDDLIVVSLSADLPARAGSDMDSQVDYCQSSEDYLKFEGSLMDQTLAQHLHDSAAGQSQSANRAVSALLGQVQSAASARAQLFPLDMQGNQILLYSQASGLSLDGAPPPLGMAGGMMGGASFKGPSLEHGAVHLSVQGGLGVDGMDCGGMGGGGGGSNSTHWGFWESVYVPLR